MLPREGDAPWPAHYLAPVPSPSRRRRPGATRICRASGRTSRPSRSSGRPRWPTSRTSQKGSRCGREERAGIDAQERRGRESRRAASSMRSGWSRRRAGFTRTSAHHWSSIRRTAGFRTRTRAGRGGRRRRTWRRNGSRDSALGADTWEDRALQERCITSDTMYFPNGFYNNYHQIVQAPGYVVLVHREHARRAGDPLDRRPHVG